MKITAYNDELPLVLSGAGGVIISNTSRTSLGSNTPLIESGSGSPGSGPQAAAWDHVHPALGGSSSFGSNSSRVASVSAAGASSSNSRADHVHDGIGTVTASSSNSLNRGTLNLRAGTGIALALSNTDGGSGLDTVTIQNIAAAGGGSGGGGSGLTVQYPALKPGTPTHDFGGSSLPGGFTAHSSGGSFATTSCMTQGAHPWPGSTLEMQFSAQMGRLQLTHANTDLDFTWGGMSFNLPESANTVAVGIAAVNSSGDGIMVVNETGRIYFGKVVARQFTTVLDNWGIGSGTITDNAVQSPPVWLRLKRVSGTWTGYASMSGRVWDKTFATDATAYTVATIEFGLFYNTGLTYSGRVLSDYVQVDV